MEQCVATIRPGIAPVHYFRGGSGEPLLYLHHIAGMQGWEPAMAELASRFDVIAPYHPGWGPSEGLDQVKTGLDLVVHSMDFLDHLEIERVNVLGHSVGAWIAAEMAAIRPDRVKRLVLANPDGIWDDEIQARTRSRRARWRRPQCCSATRSGGRTSSSGTDRLTRWRTTSRR